MPSFIIVSIINLQQGVTPSMLWEKVDAMMTDAAAKNLEVVKAVSEVLKSSHLPYHLLCKSHTCERLDYDILSALIELENKINLRSAIVSKEQGLRSFLGCSKSVVEVALAALLKLVSRETDGKTISLREQFDCTLESEGIHKSLSLYKEKRFTKLGYLAGAVYDCLPYFRKILTETPLNNLLVRACRLYVDNDFISAGFKVLANFTYRVTMPYLNFAEISSQSDLVAILPKLFHDLSNCNLNTMAQYSISWTHIKVTSSTTPFSELDSFILNRMCVKSAKGIQLQCSREYWDDADNNRATKLHKLDSEELSNLTSSGISVLLFLNHPIQ